MNKKAIQWLYSEMPRLISAGILSAETAEELRNHYGEPESISKRRIALAFFGIAGTLLVCLGMVLILAHNWNQLSRGVIREYHASVGNLSANGQRLALQPIQQADGHMAREHGFDRVADGLRISHATRKPPARVYLTDVVSFCDFLCEMAAQADDESLTRP